MSNEASKPVIGFSCGDINGIGIEIILKTLVDNRILEFCTPVIFGNNKVINFYRKSLGDINLNYTIIKDLQRPNPKQVNVMNCWEEDVLVTPGQLTDAGGKFAVKSLLMAAEALKQGTIGGLVTAPIHKKNVQREDFNYTGHTPFLKAYFNVPDVVMMMCSETFRVALVAEHVPMADIAKHISKNTIISKLKLLEKSLQRDFGVDKPKIAVLGLNPHAGDEGLIGKEEEEIIRPAIKEFKQNSSSVVFGPYSADAFFARHHHEKFDVVLAMYHDQGLIPFKSLALGEGVNYTAGLPVIRTSPDHGVAFDIAGKNKADESSLREALFTCIDIAHQRFQYDDARKNPMKKVTNKLLANVEDEEIKEDGQ
jgi:4-hydroxythreonine-4-phosphate dehydrogenase